MRKLVVAAMLGLAAGLGASGAAVAAPLFGLASGLEAARPPVVKVQSSDAARVQQLEEAIRQLNGRIEEMSFQLLQMQETIRKTQEDNEFRFQELEKGGAPAPAAAPAPVRKKADAGTPAAVDDVARLIDTPPQGGGLSAPARAGQAAPGPTVLGSIELDQKGMPVGGTLNQNAANSSAGSPASAPASVSASLPGVVTGGAAAGQGTDPVNTAALTSESDIYQSAYGYVLAGDYKLAESGFQRYIQDFPKGGKAADANFWLGEAQYSQGKFNDAAKTFLNAHKLYGKSPRAPEMLLKLGMSLAALDSTETACVTLREVPKRYPTASKAVLGKAASEQKRLGC